MNNKKRYPTAVQFILADNIREETGKKLTLLGVYVGNDILIPSGDLGKVLPTLGLLANFHGGEGNFKLTAQLFGPGPKRIGTDLEFPDVEIKSGVIHSVILNFAGFKISDFGEFLIRLLFDKSEDHVYEYKFSIKPQS